MDLKLRLEVQNSVRNWIGYFMSENNIPASTMVDAINSSLVELKDLAYYELLEAMNHNNKLVEENNGE